MQPADDPLSLEANNILQGGGSCEFDISKKGARLLPIPFGARCCTDMEKKYHSFVGEAACGWWAIGQNRMYLWGTYFY